VWEKVGKWVKQQIICPIAQWVLDIAKQVLRGVVAAMRSIGNGILNAANSVLDAAGKVHGAAISVMEGVLKFLKHFGIDYFMVSGTLKPNFWNSEISGRLKFHLGSSKFDLGGTFCLGDVGRTIKKVFNKIVDWFKKTFNPLNLFKKKVSIGDMRKKLKSYGKGDAAKCAAVGGSKWTKKYKNEECSIGNKRDNCIRAECDAMGGYICGKYDGNIWDGRYRGWCQCKKCPDMIKLENELKKNYDAAQKKLEEEKKKKEEEYNYEEMFAFTTDLPTFDDTMDVSARYSTKLLENADALSQDLPASKPLHEVLGVE
jgi:hypothetical protein